MVTSLLYGLVTTKIHYNPFFMPFLHRCNKVIWIYFKLILFLYLLYIDCIYPVMYWLDAGTTLFKIVYEKASYSFLLACCFSYATKAKFQKELSEMRALKKLRPTCMLELPRQTGVQVKVNSLGGLDKSGLLQLLNATIISRWNLQFKIAPLVLNN